MTICHSCLQISEQAGEIESLNTEINQLKKEASRNNESV